MSPINNVTLVLSKPICFISMSWHSESCYVCMQILQFVFPGAHIVKCLLKVCIWFPFVDSVFLQNTFFLGKYHNTNWWTKINSRFHVLFNNNKEKTSHYSILLMECHPVPSDPSIRKLFFLHSPLLYVLCSCILICLILPKNRLITVKQLRCILIAFMTMILAHHSERILIRSRLLIGHHDYFHLS